MEPGNDELQRLWAALGIDAAALTALSKSTSVIPLLPLAIQTPGGAQVAAKLLIDKLQVTASVHDEGRLLADVIPRLLRTIKCAKRVQPLKGSGYDKAFVPGPGLHLSVGPRHRNMKFARLSIHPASSLMDVVLALLGPELVVSSLSVTAFDVAVDLAMPLHDLQLIAHGKRKFSVYVGSRGFETMYSGKRGKGQLKVYDKIRDLEYKARNGKRDWAYPTVPQSPLTRIEATLGGIKLADIGTIDNPFENKFHVLPLRSDGLCLSDRLLVDYGRFHGWPHLKAHLGKREFDRLRTTLQASKATLSPHPADVFNDQWQDTVAPLIRSLNLGGLL